MHAFFLFSFHHFSLFTGLTNCKFSPSFYAVWNFKTEYLFSLLRGIWYKQSNGGNFQISVHPFHWPHFCLLSPGTHAHIQCLNRGNPLFPLAKCVFTHRRTPLQTRNEVTHRVKEHCTSLPTYTYSCIGAVDASFLVSPSII